MAAITAQQRGVSWFSGMWMLVRRELRDTFRDWRMITPIVLLTLFFPVLMTWTASVAQNFVNRFGTPLIGERLKVESCGDTWVRYWSDNPASENPPLLHWLSEQKVDVVTLSEVPRSLEEVYLRVVEQPIGQGS